MKLSKAAKELETSQVAVRRILVQQGLGSMSQKTIDDEVFEKIKQHLASLNQLEAAKPETKQVEQPEPDPQPEPQPQPEPEAAIEQSPEPSALAEHQEQTKEALEIVQQGFTEQNFQDAIALGTLDGIQKVALRLQTARKTELDLLAQLAQANQQTTQTQLNQATELFNDLMQSQNGQVETLGKSQLAAHKHQKEREAAIAKAQAFMQAMV